MAKVESSPLPTCSSKHEPVAAGVIVSPSSMTAHAEPLMRAEPASSSDSMCSSVVVVVVVGIRTSRIVSSAYAPSTFCISHVFDAPDTLNTATHSKPGFSAVWAPPSDTTWSSVHSLASKASETVLQADVDAQVSSYLCNPDSMVSTKSSSSQVSWKACTFLKASVHVEVVQSASQPTSASTAAVMAAWSLQSTVGHAAAPSTNCRPMTHPASEQVAS